MKSDTFLRIAIPAFALTLVGYIVAFTVIEHRRTSLGPWQITFTNDPAGTPTLIVNQPKLAITNMLVAFPGETLPPLTNSTATLALTQPRAVPFAVPFGRCVFMDATSLPGTIVFELFGHAIQLLPRVLTIDGVEQPWRSGTRLDLSPARMIPKP